MFMDISASSDLKAPLPRVQLISDGLGTSAPTMVKNDLGRSQNTLGLSKEESEEEGAPRIAEDIMPTLLARQNVELMRQNAELRMKFFLLTEHAALTDTLKRYEGVMDRTAMKRSSCQLLSQNLEEPYIVRGQSSTTAHVDIPSDAASSTSGSVFTSESAERVVDQGARQSLRTTVMMRNIPSQYTRTIFIELLDQQGFYGVYDFVYMPVDFDTEMNHGYAFINLVTPKDVDEFQTHFNGFTEWSVPSSKACEIYWSDMQGTETLIHRFRDSAMMHESVGDEFKPVLFKNGERVPFPEPTKRIRAPRRGPRTRKLRQAVRNESFHTRSVEGRSFDEMVEQCAN